MNVNKTLAGLFAALLLSSSALAAVSGVGGSGGATPPPANLGNLPGVVPIANGGTAATTATDARTNLGLGTAAVENISTSGVNVPRLSGVNTWSGKQTLNGGIGQVSSTTSSSSFTANTLYLAPIITGASSSTYSTLNSSIQYNSSSANSGAINAIVGTAQLFSTGVSNQTTGVRGLAQSLANGGAYAAGSLYGGLFEADTFGTSSFDHVIGFKVNGPTDNGNVNYQSGVYVADQTNLGSGTITLQDAIHIEGKSGTDTAVNSIGFGNGTSGINAAIFSDVANSLTMNSSAGLKTKGGLIDTGTKFTASGCSNSNTIGGATTGKYTSGTTGTCAVTITMGGGLTAPTGWHCTAGTENTPVNLAWQSGDTATTATITITTTSGDIIHFGCTGY